MLARTGSNSLTSTVFIAIPDGPRHRGRGRVKVIADVALERGVSRPHGKRHKWYEMTHFGERGTGFVQCVCGAIGEPHDI